MRLKTVKQKEYEQNQEHTEFIFKVMDLVKDYCQIKEPIYFLGYFYSGGVFLNNGTIYIAKTEYQYKDHRPVIETITLSELHEIKLLKEYPKVKEDIEFKTLIAAKESYCTVDNFLFWIDEPCDINDDVDAPYYQIIKFLNNYSKETFSTDRYCFYSKRNDDYHFILNFFVYDKKTNKEVKIYTVDDWEKVAEDTYERTAPQKLEDVIIDDLSQNISEYQKLKIKRAFLELANQHNEYFNVKNYWVMEVVKETLQPDAELHEWSCHRCFCRPELFGDIFVYDHPKLSESPSFFITDNAFTKCAVINFKTPTYAMKGIYKRYNTKAKLWILNEQEIKELTEFFNKPCNYSEYEWQINYGKIKELVKTNWHQLIFEYNHNTAGWGWGENKFDVPPEKDNDRLSDIEALPFDLPIPDFTQLLNDKDN